MNTSITFSKTAPKLGRAASELSKECFPDLIGHLPGPK